MTENREAIEQWKATLAKMGKPSLDVLVVDDEEGSRLSAKHQLELVVKCKCDCAASGHEALEMLKKKDYDMVLSDVVMSPMGGVELARAIRKTWPSQQIAFLTGYDEFPGITEALTELKVLKLVQKQAAPVSLLELFPGYGREPRDTGAQEPYRHD